MEIDYKFNEGDIIKELKSYIDKTYDGHYSKNNFQATEFIVDGGHGIGFSIGNILKYAQRYGKKGSVEDHRKDLLKGDILVDDSTYRGQYDFDGTFMHFGKHFDWDMVVNTIEQITKLQVN